MQRVRALFERRKLQKSNLTADRADTGGKRYKFVRRPDTSNPKLRRPATPETCTDSGADYFARTPQRDCKCDKFRRKKKKRVFRLYDRVFAQTTFVKKKTSFFNNWAREPTWRDRQVVFSFEIGKIAIAEDHALYVTPVIYIRNRVKYALWCSYRARFPAPKWDRTYIFVIIAFVPPFCYR